MKISDLKPVQKIIINGATAEYKEIKKVKIANFGKVEKRVFQDEEATFYKYYNLDDGIKTFKS